MTKAQVLIEARRALARRAVIRTGPGDAGERLIDLLCRRFSYLGRGAWERHIAEGRLRVNGAPASGDRRLAAGDGVEFHMPPMEEPPVDRGYAVVYDDRRLIAVDKPGNLPCHPAGRYFRHTLWALLLERGVPQPIFIHRIDRETSGLVLVAKDRRTARRLGQEFAAGRVFKRYLAVVEGRFPEKALRAAGILHPDLSSTVRKKRRFSVPADPGCLPPGAESCRTDFSREAVAGGLSLVEALPRTGRAHQIRATLCSLGFPVVGDKLYGVDDTLFLRFLEGCLTSEDRRRLRIDRQALHASELRVPGAADGRTLRLLSPLPADMAALLAGSPRGSRPST